MFVFFLVVLLLIPATMIILGSIWNKKPPKKINWIYGYRTLWSTKSKETWGFAHRHIGKIWAKLGVILLVGSIPPFFYFRESDLNTLGIIVLLITIFQLSGLILPILSTELALRKKFDEEGKIK